MPLNRRSLRTPTTITNQGAKTGEDRRGNAIYGTETVEAYADVVPGTSNEVTTESRETSVVQWTLIYAPETLIYGTSKIQFEWWGETIHLEVDGEPAREGGPRGPTRIVVTATEVRR